MLQTYWNIGRRIVEEEQNGNERAEYSSALLTGLSKELTKEYGKGFSKSNLFSMRRLYLEFQKFQTLSGKLSWSHYLLLLGVGFTETGVKEEYTLMGEKFQCIEMVYNN